MERIIKAWEDITEILKNDVTEISFRTWFMPLAPVRIDDKERMLYLVTNNQFAEAAIKNRYWDVLNASVQRVLGLGYRVEIITDKEKDENNINISQTDNIVKSEKEYLESITKTLSSIEETLGQLVDVFNEIKDKSSVGNNFSDIVAKVEDYIDSHEE